MINYYFNNQYDKENKYRPYTHKLEANDDTLPPDNALRVAPPEKEGFIACEHGGKWVLVEDNRKKTAYNIETKEAVKIDYFGKIKDGFTLLKPFEFCKWDTENKKWVKDKEAERDSKIKQNEVIRDSLLNEANAEIDILNRAVRLRRASDADKKRLESLENYTIDLYELDLNDVNAVFPKAPS